LTLSGEDRLRLLNGLVTCEVKGLAVGRGVHGFFTDVKGHVLADVVVWAVVDGLRLEVPLSQRQAIAAHIARYVVADRVEIEPSDDQVALALAGPAAAEHLADLAGEEAPKLPDSAWTHGQVTLADQPAWVTLESRVGQPTWTLWVAAVAAAELRRELVDRDVREIGPQVLEAVRLAAGSPVFGIDYGSENLPQETGLDDAVSYTKGCYLGQEVVARLHYRGQVARRLARLRGADLEPPPPGTAVLLDGREVGSVTSAAASPDDGSTRMWAMLQRRALAVGTRVQVDGREVEVVG
jgi:folate-binding protein YgfZ